MLQQQYLDKKGEVMQKLKKEPQRPNTAKVHFSFPQMHCGSHHIPRPLFSTQQLRDPDCFNHVTIISTQVFVVAKLGRGRLENQIRAKLSWTESFMCHFYSPFIDHISFHSSWLHLTSGAREYRRLMEYVGSII